MCGHVGCERPSRKRGLCQTHYSQLRRLTSKLPAELKCGCGQPVHAKQLCQGCYNRQRSRNRCRIDGCGNTAWKAGRCKRHRDVPLEDTELMLPTGPLLKLARHSTSLGRNDMDVLKRRDHVRVTTADRIACRLGLTLELVYGWDYDAEGAA